MAPSLEHCFTLRCYMSKESPLSIGTVSGGLQRSIACIPSGFLRGEGFEGEIVPPSGDWLQIDTTSNTARMDVRAQARSKEGHVMFIQYRGLMQIDEKSGKVLSGASDAETTSFGDHETFFSSPVIEASDPNLKWCQSTVFVGEGRWVVDGDGSVAVEYEIYRLRASNGSVE